MICWYDFVVFQEPETKFRTEWEEREERGEGREDQGGEGFSCEDKVTNFIFII